MTTLSRIGIQKWISRQDLFDRVVKYIIENMGKLFRQFYRQVFEKRVP